MTTKKPTYEELEHRIKELEHIVLDLSRDKEEPEESRNKSLENQLIPIMSEAEKLANSGSWEWDIVRDKWTMSDNWLKIHGYKNKVLTTEELLTIAHPDDLNRIQEAFNHCINHGTPYEIEHRIVRHGTKEVRYIRAHGRVENDSNGKPVKLYGAAQDITEYKRQEVELKQSEEQYRTLVESTPDLITKVDSTGRITFVNHAAQDIYGLPPEECLGRSAFNFIHPEDRAATIASFNGWLQCPDSVFIYENRIVSIDEQRTHHMTWIIVPERDACGSIIGFAATARDITDHKLAEEALRKINKDLQLAERIAHIGNWTLDPEVGVPEWTDEVYRIYERDPELGPYSLADYQNLYKGIWLEKFTTSIQRAIHEGQPYDIELKLELAPDNIKWVHAICEPELKNGSKTYFLRGTIQDITERKQTEDALWKSQKVLEETSKIGKVGGWEYDFVEGKLFWSSENYRIFGCPEDITPTYELFFEKVHPDDNEKVLQHFEESKKTGSFDIEFRLLINDQVKWVHGKANIILENKEPIRAFGFTQDITKLKSLQSEQIRSSQLITLGEIASGVAHEINNPINGIINYAQILVNENDENDKSNKILKRIIKEGDRIANIVKTLLNFARKDRGNFSYLDLIDIVIDPFSLYSNILKSDGIHLEIKMPDDLPKIYGNRLQLEQVIINLISNARHALNTKFPGPSEEKIIVIEATSSKNQNDECVQLKIKDTGCGIPQNHLDKIFNPFFTTKEAGVGTGLGMSISLDILERHGAMISIDSEVNKFTIVTITLPVKSQ